MYRVRACAHARRCAAPERIPVCPDARSANLRSCNWCPVACPPHTLRMFATKGRKETKRRRGPRVEATGVLLQEQEEEKEKERETSCERRVKDEGDRAAKKREGSKKQKEGGGMRGSRRRSCRR